MKFKRNVLAFLVISILGTLFHFLYDWFGENIIFGFFFPVNESIWEHLKLVFYPALIYFIIEHLIVKEKKDNLISQIAISIYFGMGTIIILYYLYYGILGFNVDVLNIIIFLISVAMLIRTRNKIYNEDSYNSKNCKTYLIISLTLIAFLFAVWSINPPELGIFNY